MMYFWVTFKDRAPGTVQGEGDWYPTSKGVAEMRKRGATPEEFDAWHEARRDKVRADVRQRASEFGEVASVNVLPYPADPRLDVRSNCPSFCWMPGECKGQTSCPRRRSCCD